ncbi:hypothetical protein Ocin01_15987 [Orchesella cincta]|uniref:Uncharacterized protein n=1 Tax=Orchesella cincta TaxID=48709 RepID=A0A1D2MCG5_ORCCI|nr:hypothetical protein Ocin01_15987 [Orchesella cincta]
MDKAGAVIPAPADPVEMMTCETSSQMVVFRSWIGPTSWRFLEPLQCGMTGWEPKRTESLISEHPSLSKRFSENLLLGRELCQSWKEELEYKIQTNPSHTSLFEIDSGQHWILISAPSGLGAFCRQRWRPVRDDDWTAYWTSVFYSWIILGHTFILDIWFSEWDELQPEQLTMDTHVDKSPLENWIRDYYRLNPLPRLEHLETVQLNSASPALVGEVVNSCCVPANIKRLSYQHGQWHADRGELPEVVYSFVNLEVLDATIFFRCFERLASLERRPPLRELHLTFEDAPYFEDVFRLEIFCGDSHSVRHDSRIHVRNGESSAAICPT